MSKLKVFDESAWEERREQLRHMHPLKELKNLPEMQGITKETAKNLKWKSLKWMITKDKRRAILKGFLRHPFKYGIRFLSSLMKDKPFLREGDFFLYGVQSVQEFERLLEDTNALFVLGFSYCHKPLECPSGRFSDACINSSEHPVCGQCFINKALQLSQDSNTIPLIIPTVHYVGEKMFEIVHKNPKKKVVFMITACEMTLQMFGDYGNMVGIQGVGIRLGGRICNTMKAFELSEEGIKPGLTVVLEDTKKEMLHLLRQRQKSRSV